MWPQGLTSSQSLLWGVGRRPQCQSSLAWDSQLVWVPGTHSWCGCLMTRRMLPPPRPTSALGAAPSILLPPGGALGGCKRMGGGFSPNKRAPGQGQRQALSHADHLMGGL